MNNRLQINTRHVFRTIVVVVLSMIVFCTGCFYYPSGDSSAERTEKSTEKSTEKAQTAAPDNSSTGYTLTIECEKNLAMAKFDVEIQIDGQKIAVLPHGEKQTYELNLTKGNHNLIVYKEGDESISGTKAFSVDSPSGTIKCYIINHTKYIEFKTFEITGNASSETKRQEPTAEPSSEEKTSPEPTTHEPTTPEPEDISDAGYYVLIYYKQGDNELDETTLEVYKKVMGHDAYIVLEENHKGYVNTFGNEHDLTWGDGKIEKADYLIDGDILELHGDDFIFKYRKSSDTPPEREGQKTEETTAAPTTVAPTTVAPKDAKIGIGEEFGNRTIKGAVISVDLDYKDYNDVWVDVGEGDKAVYVRILVTNISNRTNYVSAGDFSCYADNIAVSADLFADGEYNANIAPGRSAILGALYVVPKGTKTMELEYNPIGEKADRQIIVIQDGTETGTRFVAEEALQIAKNTDATKGVKTIGIGEEFGNKTITGEILDVNLDYKNYNSLWTEVPAGSKAVYIRIKLTNISDKSNYVSVGDFDCYADNIIMSAELVTGGKEEYNENIDPGRSVILGAMYVIPISTQSLELEYSPLGESADRVIIKIQ